MLAHGKNSQNHIKAKETKGQENMSENWWRPDHFQGKKENLHKRAEIIRDIRRFFEQQDYLEVETPILQQSPGMETHVHAFSTEKICPHLEQKTPYFLQTSPEFAMKKLLVADMGKIFQLCKCFRNAEDSPNHSVEFTMLEWYHPLCDYTDLMREVMAMIRYVCKTPIVWRDMSCDVLRDWDVLSVSEAFLKYAGIDLDKYLDDTAGLLSIAAAKGIHIDGDEGWDDAFFRIFLEKIEPHLGVGVPCILYDYPAHMAALSRKKPNDPRYAERFEVYICGLELANAFGELTDAAEQKKRFENAMQEKQALYGTTWPVDQNFVQALEHGMPETSGIALGIDRLVMLITGVDDLTQIMAYRP